MTRFERTSDSPTENKKTLVSDQSDFADSNDALWRQFASAASLESYCTGWLALQCQIIEGVHAGVVLIAPQPNKPFAPIGFWPDKNQDLSHLAKVAERSMNEKRGLILKETTGTDLRYDVAFPVQVAGQTYAVVVLEVDSRPEEELRNCARQLQWGASWLEVLFHRRQPAKAVTQQNLDAVIGLLAGMVTQKSFRGSATALVTAISTKMKCDRASIGFLRRGSIRVEALSHSAQFGKDTGLVRAIGVAMDETADQEQAVVFPLPPDSKPVVTRGHGELSRQYGNGSICSIPIRGQQGIVGVLTLERPGALAFDPETVAFCESVCAIAGPVLEVHKRDDRWLIVKIVDAVRIQLGHLIGSRHIPMKLAVLGTLAVIIFFAFAQGQYRVTAKTVIEPSTKQGLVAAFDAYIRSAPFRAGDVVQKDQILATLDDRDLVLERGKSESLQQQSLKQYYEALGNRNASEVQIYTAQMEQAKAQVALLNEQIARTKIAAPFDGMIVTGDLSQSIGSPVQRGQVLFELAPLDSYRIILQVDERQIADVKPGQKGRLLLSGFADEPLDFSVGRMTPVSTASEGRNYFRVEAKLENVPKRLRPNMEGIGKIEVDRRLLIWVWTHEVIDWLRLKTWNWLP